MWLSTPRAGNISNGIPPATQSDPETICGELRWQLQQRTLKGPSEHLIPNELLTRQVRVVVVGCGGTGSAIAGGLPYLHQAMLAHGHPGGLHVTLGRRGPHLGNELRAATLQSVRSWA